MQGSERETKASLRVVRHTTTLRELTLEKLREAILAFRFKPGYRLVERDLCAQLGVSRTIVREVLRHLESEGLVATVPLKGPVVARPTEEQAAQIYEIRAMLEALAARRCAELADRGIARALDAALRRIAQAYTDAEPLRVLSETNEFYRILFEASGKTVAWDIVRSLNARINQLRAMTISTPGRPKSGVAEMKRIVDAIRQGDGDKAHRACIEHVGNAAKLAKAALQTLAEKAP